jgi:very-short-patch-repair endonuclease/predicted transcriptional regulator of viral defense system
VEVERAEVERVGVERAGVEREAALAALASRQHGVVSRRQLIALGFGRQAILRRLQARRLRRLHPGVYAVGHWALTPASRHLAAVLACGPGALLSHRSAGVRHRLLYSGGQGVEVTAPRSRAPRAGLEMHRTRHIHPDDRAEQDGIPVTSVARTIVDLAAVLDDRRLTAVVNEAEVQRVFDLEQIEAAIERANGRAGPKRLKRVLANYTEPPGYSTNKAEALFMALCTRHDLPRPQRIAVAGYELDFYWPDAPLAVEVDGRAIHGTRKAFEEDRKRDRVLGSHDIDVAHATWLDLTRAPEQLAADLHAMRRERMRRGA